MACLLLLAPLGCATFAVEFTGQVVEVIDGNTLTYLHDGDREHIRLYGIDCPELAQEYGKEARQAAANWALGKTITVKAWGLDKYGHTVGIVILPDGTNLNHELVSAGLAWWDRRFPNETRLAELEAEARAARRGLWAGVDPIPPWEFRERPKSRGSASSGQGILTL